MVKPTAAGASTRRAILLELRRRELAGERPPTLAELAAAAGGVETSTALRQLRNLRSAGLVAPMDRAWRNRGAALTEAGRMAADSMP